MKKILLGLMLLGAAPAMAQNQESMEMTPVEKYGVSVKTNPFWNNWFITLGGDYVSNFSDQELGMDLSKNPFESFRRSWNGELAVGKWFTPVIGVRSKLQLMSMKSVDGKENPDLDMLIYNVQGMVNLRNLFAGYRPGRVWDISLYAGTGFYRNITDKHYAFMYTAGILNTFNVTKRLYINVDLYHNLALNDIDNVYLPNTPKGNFFTERDRQYGLSLGLGVNLGKVGWSQAPDLEAINAMHKAQTDALNASLAEQQSENERLKELLAKRPESTTTNVQEKEVVLTTPVSVFFNINSSRIASKKDLVNVEALVKLAKENNAKVEVYGFADSKTGPADFNMKLSERRANTVAKELKKMGLKDEQIIVKPMGGVADLDPASYNRRVIVTVAK